MVKVATTITFDQTYYLFFTECGKKRKIKVPYPIQAVERYLPERGWIKNNTLQKNHFYPKMVIIPSFYSNIFTAN